MKFDDSGHGYAGDAYHQSVAVLSADVLGMKSLLESDHIALRAANALDGLIGQTLSSQSLSDPSDPLRFFSISRYFGDSVYLFADPSAPLKTQVRKLTALAAFILWCGLVTTLKEHTHAYPPRIGIGQGNLRIRAHDDESPPYEVRIGDSMALAHKIEQAQVWTGGALPAELCHVNDPYWVEYDTPLKQPYDGPPLCAVNWLPIAMANPDQYSMDGLVRDMADYSTRLEDQDARIKWRNAHAFAVSILDRSRG